MTAEQVLEKIIDILKQPQRCGDSKINRIRAVVAGWDKIDTTLPQGDKPSVVLGN